MPNSMSYFLSIGFLAILVISGAVSISGSMTAADSTLSSIAIPSPLPDYKIVQYSLPNGSSQPWGITADRLGRIWFVEEESNQIGMFDPRNSSFSEYKITTPNSLLEEIATDAMGNVWFTELQGERLGELDPATGNIKQFKMPVGPETLPCGPIGVTPSMKGEIWITCEFSNQIDEFFPSNSTFLSFNLPVFYSAPTEIVFDSKGNFWFSAADSDMLGYVSVSQVKNGTTDGIQEFAPTNQTYLTTINNTQIPSISNNGESLPGQTIVSSLQTPSQIALSSDGNSLWITEHVVSSFDQYNIQTKSLIKYWTAQTHNPSYTTSLPNGIAIDSSGNVWIAEHYGNKIAEFDPTTGQMAEYPIPCCGDQIAGTLYLALGKNGTVWFTEFFGNAIGELVPQDSPAPVSIASAENPVQMSSNSQITIPIEISSTTTGAASFDISGISGTGKLENATAAFKPASTISIPNGELATSLILSTNGLKPGAYQLTVGVKLSASGVIYSEILKLDVTSGSDFKSLLIYGAAIGIVGSIVVIGSLVVLSRRAKMSRIRQRRRKR